VARDAMMAQLGAHERSGQRRLQPEVSRRLMELLYIGVVRSLRRLSLRHKFPTTHSGRPNINAEATAETITMPAPSGCGAEWRVTMVNTTNAAHDTTTAIPMIFTTRPALANACFEVRLVIRGG
jgi:hypothetical protein